MAALWGALAGALVDTVDGGATDCDMPLFEGPFVFGAVLDGALAAGGGMIATDGDQVPPLAGGVGAVAPAAED
jgi:hypothetical protein